MTTVSDIEQADIATAETVAPLRRTPAVRLLGALSELADQPQLISICIATLGFGLVTRNGRLARTGARMLAAELVATQIKTVIKHRVDRTRPRVPDDGGTYKAEPGHDHASEMSSFPSGHTAGAVAVARAIARGYPEHRGAAYGAAAAVAVIQVPRCQHYPSDLGAGALVGLAGEALVTLGERALRSAVARTGS